MEFSHAGFRKRSDGIFTRTVAESFDGWVGLNHAHRGEFVEINPVMGIRSQEIESMVAACLDEPFHSYIPPTVSVSLGYLMPQHSYKPWLFAERIDSDSVCDLVAAVVSYGLPFVEAGSSIEALIELLQDPKFSHEDSRKFRLPVAYFLLGEVRSAMTLSEDYLRSLGSRQDMAAEEYRRFAFALRKVCKETS